MRYVKTGIIERVCHCVSGPAPFEAIDKPQEASQRILIKAKCFSNFSGRGSAAIGDDISAHSGAKFSITLVDMLNCLFALIPRGEVQINIRPFSPVLAEKTFE